MTTIAWDGKTLAADRRAMNCGLAFSVTKIFELNDGRLFGISNTLSTGYEVMAWLNNGAKPSEYPAEQKSDESWARCVVISRGEILVYCGSWIPIRHEDKYFACGSGRDYALAAMYCGKSSVEAVEIAAHFNPETGNGIDRLELLA